MDLVERDERNMDLIKKEVEHGERGRIAQQPQ